MTAAHGLGGTNGKYRDPRQVAIEKVRWILDNHHPEPLEAAQRAELARILAGPLVDPLPEAVGRELDEILTAADRELARE